MTSTTTAPAEARARSTPTTTPMPTAYIPHGGGPCFFMDWTMGPPDTWDSTAAFLGRFRQLLPREPKAIVVVSGHHEGAEIEVMTGPRPPMLFDYYGFPAHTYELEYPAPGDPHLANRILELLRDAQIEARPDASRGFDHGVFVPMLLMFPEAEIPVVQMSLRSDLDPEFHLKLGQAIASLRHDDVLLLGSGMSYHSMRGYGTRAAVTDSRNFDDWLQGAAAASGKVRWDKLANWLDAPAARASHPREEHLLPLMVVAGAAENEPGRGAFTDEVMNARISAFVFGAAA